MSSHKTDDIEVTIKLSYSLAVLFTVLLDSLVGAMFKLLQDGLDRLPDACIDCTWRFKKTCDCYHYQPQTAQ